MTMSLDWVEEALQWVETETNTMAIKLKNTHKARNYRGDVAVSLVTQDKDFFQKLEQLQVSLEEVHELASQLVCITDLAQTDEPESEGTDCG